ncbi:MAG: hypothetical protein ACK4YQ_08295 [Phenylobacterium sp.]|uniref:hypothetical protein n=1 Tax=Phenylobacterium sp. TaxID=1871053 RepID=UPI00391AE365
MRLPLDIPAGLFADDTTFAAAGRWVDMDNMRFRLGRPQVRGGWESVVGRRLSGVCRAALAWTDNAATLNLAFGTHEGLELYQGGGLYDLTPVLGRPARTLTDGLTVTDGSTTILVAHPRHGLANGDEVVVSNAEPVGRITPDGAFTITVVDDDSYSFEAASPADLAKTLGSNPLSVSSGSTTVKVAEAGHRIAEGTSVTISGAAAVGGVTPNGTFPIKVVDADTYSYEFTAPATSSATGGGASVVARVAARGGGLVVVAPQAGFEGGQVDGTGSSGFGTGGYGVGGFGQPSTADYFPRTWSLSAWGQNLVANPRGGAIYEWAATDKATPAAPLKDAPANTTYALVTPTRQVMALGANEELSNVFNPVCIRVSHVGDNADWTTRADNLAEEIILSGGGRLVAGRVVGPYVLAWTNHGLFLGSFVGSTAQGWRFDQIGRNCGLIGPNAAVVFGQTAFWISPDRQFWSCTLGGAPTPIDCPVRDDFADNLAASQADKIMASSISEFGEVRWDYPDAREGFENSRYLVLQVAGPDAGAWSKGVMARSAMIDAGPSLYPLGATPEGDIYWHERGQSADGAPMSAFVATGDLYLADEYVTTLAQVWPDLAGQIGGVKITDAYRFEPQGDSVSEATGVMAPGERKADLRATGRLHRLRFEVESSPAFFRLGRVVLDVRPAGGR